MLRRTVLIVLVVAVPEIASSQPQSAPQEHETLTHEFDLVAKVVNVPNGQQLADVVLKVPSDVERLEFRPGDIVTVARKGTGALPAETWTQEWKWGGSGGFFGIGAKKGDKAEAKQAWSLAWGGDLRATLVGADNNDVAVMFPKSSGDARDQAMSVTNAGEAKLEVRVTQPAARKPPRPDVPKKATSGPITVKAEVSDGQVIDTLVVTIKRPSSAPN